MKRHGDIAPVTTKLARSGDHDLYAEFRGDPGAPVVVLLHSGLGSIADWRATAPVLAGCGFRTIAYDRLGHGASPRRPGNAPPPFDGDVAELIGLLDALELPKVNLVGHSDGGTIALQAAARYGDRVTSLVAVSAHVCVELKTRDGIAAFASRARDDERILSALERRHGDKATDVLEGWVEAWLSPEALRWDIRHELPAIDCPTLVVQGLDDEYATPDHAQDIADGVPGSDLWLVPGANHLVPQAVADEFNQRLLGFFDTDRDSPA